MERASILQVWPAELITPNRQGALTHTLRFMTVGAVGTALDVLLFSLLRIRLGIPSLLANTVSYSTGTVNNYVMHRNWTFAGQGHKAFGVQFAQFVVVSLCALAVNNLLLLALEPAFDALFQTTELGEMIAKACAMTAGMCLSYLLQNRWTFRYRTY